MIHNCGYLLEISLKFSLQGLAREELVIKVVVRLVIVKVKPNPTQRISVYPFFNMMLGKKSLREIRQLYIHLKDEVFGTGRLGLGYNTKKLEEILKNEFGDMKMSDVKYPR